MCVRAGLCCVAQGQAAGGKACPRAHLLLPGHGSALV